MEKPSTEKKNKKFRPQNYLILLAMTVVFIAIFGGDSFGLGKIVQMRMDLSLLWLVIPVFLYVFLTQWGLYRIARRFELPAVLLLDRHLLPRILARRTGPERDLIASARPVRTYWQGNPELINASPALTTTNYGVFTTELGEQVLNNGKPFFPNWDIRTAYRTTWERGWFVLCATLLLTVIVAFFQLSAYVLMLLAGLTLLSAVYTSMMRYWAKEWLRYGEFLIITTHRYIQAISHFSWIGLLTGKGFDIQIKTNAIETVRDADQKAIPRSYGIRIGPIMEMALEVAAESQSHVGTIIIFKAAGPATDIFMHYNFAPAALALLQHAQKNLSTLNRDLADIHKRKNDHARGKPYERQGGEDVRLAEGEDWAIKEYARMGYPLPHDVNVFALRETYLQSLVAASSGSQASPPVQSPVVPVTSTAPSTVGDRFTRTQTKVPFMEAWQALTPLQRDQLYQAGFTFTELQHVHDHTVLDVQGIVTLLQQGYDKDDIFRELQSGGET